MASILVIEDDEQIRDYLRWVLESQGHSFRQARHGLEGMLRFREEPAELVVCDIFMDRQDGLATIRELMQFSPAPKIIAISGGSNMFPDDYLQHAKRFGAAAVLYKPFCKDQLLQTVTAVLTE